MSTSKWILICSCCVWSYISLIQGKKFYDTQCENKLVNWNVIDLSPEYSTKLLINGEVLYYSLVYSIVHVSVKENSLN